MKITVITVTYNSQKYLEACMQSVIQQSYNNVEYIIIDGASKDKTMQIVKSYGGQLAHALSEPDNGIYDAINKGIQLSTGDIVGILNSDDFFTDSYVLENIANEFKEHENLDAIYADVAFVDREFGIEILRYYSSKMFKPWMFRLGFQPAHPTFYVRRNLFEKFGLYRTDMKIAADFELLTRFIAKNKIKSKYINKQLVSMRIGGVSTSGLKSIFLLNSEIVSALKINEIYSNRILIYSKYIFKIWGYVFK